MVRTLGFVLCLLCGAALAQAPDARLLGTTESALHYCAGLGPEAAFRLRLRTERMVHGVPDGQLQKIRQSDEYQKAYSAESDFVAKVEQRNAARVCNQPLARSH